jgi:hypothetical protein
LNGPQGGLAFDLECLDSSQFQVPPAPALASEQYATELVELYWASLLRDIAFLTMSQIWWPPKRPVNSPRCPIIKDREIVARRLHQTCCSAAASLVRRLAPTFHSLSSRIPAWGLCRSFRNTRRLLLNYTGGDAGQMTVNGELHKLAHNISFGHGMHAGIHWRSDTDTSIQLGEAIALSILQDRAHTYNEKFTIKLKKLDGSIAIITNQ